MKIRIIKYEQNPNASASTCHNGGGYFQPLYILQATDNNGNTLWKAEICDKDCGEFGDEVGATIAIDGTLYDCWYGTRTEGNEYSNIPYDKCKRILEAIHLHLGYSLPVQNDEWCWHDAKKGDIDIDHLISEIVKDHAASVAYGYDLDPDTPYVEWYSDDEDDDDDDGYTPWICEYPEYDDECEDDYGQIVVTDEGDDYIGAFPDSSIEYDPEMDYIIHISDDKW